MPAERVQKILARAGIGSRRVCEDLISDGRVTVNGKPAKLGGRADAATDRIEVDGVIVPVAPGLVHILLNKPSGFVTTVSDPEGRPTVMELVPREDRLFPVGRLDIESEGLLVVTNDGDLANLLTHPSHGIEKAYLVEVTGRLHSGAVAKLKAGVELDDGTTLPAKARLVGERQGRKLIEVRIHEGRNQQVRRMIEAVGGRVVRLARIRIGSLTDRSLKPGKWRKLKAHEVRALYEEASEPAAIDSPQRGTARGRPRKSGRRTGRRRAEGRRQPRGRT